MADEIPVSEVRRIVINYEIKTPNIAPGATDPSADFERALAERIRNMLIKTGNRNPDIFGGRA